MVSIDFVSDSQQVKLYDYVEQNTMSHIGFRIRGIQLPKAVLPRVVKNSLVAMIKVVIITNLEQKQKSA